MGGGAKLLGGQYELNMRGGNYRWFSCGGYFMLPATDSDLSGLVLSVVFKNYFLSPVIMLRPVRPNLLNAPPLGQGCEIPYIYSCGVLFPLDLSVTALSFYYIELWTEIRALAGSEGSKSESPFQPPRLQRCALLRILHIPMVAGAKLKSCYYSSLFILVAVDGMLIPEPQKWLLPLTTFCTSFAGLLVTCKKL
ncbi:hypothetical protein FGO68_gene5427 [Halteria grandinella]|uniref:Uncharacterized protein n=1 Tax=Halteria grandinella TaxID=5974 RepID=A0A8J8NGP1_HALGN|nr:hypothetical protein FGO68_gene5427 [Halteria grandinella]